MRAAVFRCRPGLSHVAAKSRPTVRMSASTVGVQPGSIWAVGKNYLEHIKELKSVLNIDQEVPKEPIIFLKSGGSVVMPSRISTPQPLPLPTHWSSNVHHEVELAVQLGPDLTPVRAAVAIDMTARDVQNALKNKGYPWTLAKSFPAACPLGSWFDCTSSIDLHELTIHLEVNGVTRQHASTGGMIFKIPQLLAYLTTRFPLQPGDIVLTGTPEGVGQLVPGDEVRAWLSTSQSGPFLSTGHWLCTAAEISKL